MRILLANVPWERKDKYGVRAGSRWPFTLKPDDGGKRSYLPFPFFLAYAAALLKKSGEEISLIDAIAEGMNYEIFQDKLKAYGPDIIVLEASTPSFENDIKVIKEIKLSLDSCRIVLSGPHASVFAGDILREHEFIDYILVGEYEYILFDLINCLKKNSGFDEVSGLAYRENNKVKISKRRPTISKLDDLPWPFREGLPIYNYNDGFCGLAVPNVQVLASRGCPYQCSFCILPQAIYGENVHRKRMPARVIDEIQYLLKEYNFKAIYFDDDVFNVDRNYVFAICRKLRERNINTPWAVMAKVDLMDKNLLVEMRNSGLYAVKYGIESADQNVLEFCRKKLDLDKAKEIIKTTKNLGIKVHLTFCLGLPKENRRSIGKTIDFIDEVEPDSLQISFATPFPGTDYFSYVKDNGYLLSEKWSDYDGNYKCIVETDELSADELERIRDDLCNRYHL